MGFAGIQHLPGPSRVIPLLTYFTILSALRGIALKFLEEQWESREELRVQTGMGKEMGKK